MRCLFTYTYANCYGHRNVDPNCNGDCYVYANRDGSADGHRHRDGHNSSLSDAIGNTERYAERRRIAEYFHPA